jgi:hypothetical protein
MSNDIYSEIIRKYPKLFPADLRYRSFSCKSGWWPLLHETLQKIEKVLDENETFCIDCIKEKFGCLRLYYTGNNEQAILLVREAENKSSSVCEYCGKPGKMRSGSWLKVRCDECQTQFEEEKNR